MGKMMRYIFWGVASNIFFAGIVGCTGGPEFVFVAEDQTAVYEDYPPDGPPSARIVGVMNEGEVVPIIHIRYAKDAAYYKVRMQDGTEGYVGWGGKFRIEGSVQTSVSFP